MNRIQHCIRVLCPSGDYAAAAQAYFTARLIIAYAPGGDYHTALRISEPLRHALYQYRDIVSSALTEEQADVWCEFCGELSRTGLDADHRTFFQTVTPGAVLQWDAFARALSSNRIGEQLVALCLILRDAPPASLGVSQDWLRQHYDAVGATYHRIHLSYAQYAECWHAVHHAGLADSSHAPGGAIVQAMRLYHSLQLPMTDLLSDYAALDLEQGAAARRIATRGARRRSPTAPVAEGGRSEQDRELEHRLLALAQEAPTDAVRGLFYPPVRNDAGFECTFLLQQFYGAATPRDRVLVVNPSPDMICHMMRDRMACNRLLFLVADETLASLYARQFGCDIFVAPAALDSRSCQYDRILLTSRDQPVEPLLECLRWAAPGTRVTALIPETSLQTVHSHLAAAGLRIRTVLSVPREATQSSPRRKVLVEADGHSGREEFLLLQGVCDRDKTLF